MDQWEFAGSLWGRRARRPRPQGDGGLCCAAIIGFLPRIEAQPIEATPQALRASSPSSGAKTLHPHGDGDSHAAEAAVRCSPSSGAKKLYTEGDGDSQGAEAAALKPPLLGEVARRSRDGGVSGLCCAAIIGFLSRTRSSAKCSNPSGAARQLP